MKSRRFLGVAEGIAEKGFTGAAAYGVGVITGGELGTIVWDAKEALARSAREMGAHAVIGMSYAIAGREQPIAWFIHLMDVSV